MYTHILQARSDRCLTGDRRCLGIVNFIDNASVVVGTVAIDVDSEERSRDRFDSIFVHLSREFMCVAQPSLGSDVREMSLQSLHIIIICMF